MKKLLSLLCVLLLIFTLSFSSFAISLPEPTDEFFVNDFVNIIDENGMDVTHNYKINKEIGLLKITLRPITITTPSSGVPSGLISTVGYVLCAGALCK